MECMQQYTVDLEEDRTKPKLNAKNALLDRDYQILFGKSFNKKDMKLCKNYTDVHKYKFCVFSLAVSDELNHHDNQALHMATLVRFNFFNAYDRYPHDTFKTLPDYIFCFRLITNGVNKLYAEFFERLEYIEFSYNMYGELYPKTIIDILARLKRECHRKSLPCLLGTPLQIVRILWREVNNFLARQNIKNQFDEKLRLKQASFKKDSDHIERAIKRITEREPTTFN